MPNDAVPTATYRNHFHTTINLFLQPLFPPSFFALRTCFVFLQCLPLPCRHVKGISRQSYTQACLSLPTHEYHRPCDLITSFMPVLGKGSESMIICYNTIFFFIMTSFCHSVKGYREQIKYIKYRNEARTWHWGLKPCSHGWSWF